MTCGSHRMIFLAPMNKSSGCEGIETTRLRTESGVVGPSDRGISWVGSLSTGLGSVFGESKRTHSWGISALWGPNISRQHMKF